MKSLDDINIIEKVDQAKMRDILTKFPEQCQQAFQLGKEFSLSLSLEGVKDIVFCGMGGSAIGAEVASFYLRKEIRLAIHINRDYSLPEFVGKRSLVVLISYSGNTEETLSAYKQAQQRQAKIIIITSGGELGDLAKRDIHPCLLIPKGFPPRGALAYLSLPVLAIFSQLGLITDKEKEVSETISVLQRLEKDSLGIAVSTEANPAKKLAGELLDKFCVIYGAAEQLTAVVTRWRGQFAENSKMLASSHVLPEMNHNELVGWQHPKKVLEKFIAIFLRDRGDHPQVRKRIEINKEILQKEGVQIKEVFSEGEGLLARIFSLIYIGDFTSFYLAILNSEDPTPVKRIDYLKRKLKES